MKILALPDSHGNPQPYETAVKLFDSVDKVIFLGDYFDHGTIAGFSFDDQFSNFLNILELKKKNPDKVKVLIGNHDFCYLIEGMAREHADRQGEIKKVIDDNSALIDFAYFEKDWLFSHAGFAANWMMTQGMQEFSAGIIEELNRLFHEQKYDSLGIRGSDLVGFDPLEIRSESLKELAEYLNVNQVVGHTEIFEEDRVHEMPGGKKLVFLDSPERNVYGIVDTEKSENVVIK